ncbi:MAG TPA: hypothetical protein VM260_00130, partial [Pirellula sp.]|nr:hypothetical protein [Pirellula sp.]
MITASYEAWGRSIKMPNLFYPCLGRLSRDFGDNRVLRKVRSRNIPIRKIVGSETKLIGGENPAQAFATWSGSVCLVAFFEVDISLLHFQSRPR